MKVFAILQEPASYVIDRNYAIYDPLGIKYAYINKKSEAKVDDSESIENVINDLPFWQKLSFIWHTLKENDIVIMNGYANVIFVMLFSLNLFWGRFIGVASDTQLVIPTNRLKRLAKQLYLNFVFRNKHIYGLPGGTNSHTKLFSYYGMSENRICLMPMMVNNSKFYDFSQKSKTPFTFLYVGRIIKCKNLGVMLDAFVHAFPNQKDVALHIVGGGELLDDYQKRYGVYTNILFKGKLFGKNLIDEYHRANVLILPSTHEPWGLVVNEAMSAGLPVLVSDCVGASFDLVEGHNTGFVFPSNNIEVLTAKMKVLQSDAELYNQLSNNAFDRMRSYWNYDLYRSCLQSFIKKCTPNGKNKENN